MLKKILLIAGISLFCLHAASWEQIKNSKKLEIGTEGDYEPYSYHDKNGDLVGYDVEIARAVAAKLGLDPVFYEESWDRLISRFKEGKGDVIFNQVFVTNERKKLYDFTRAYSKNFSVIISHVNNQSLHSINDIKGKKAAATPSSSYGEFLLKAGANIVPVSNFDYAAELVIAKRADIFMNDGHAFFEFKKKRPNAPLKIAIKDEQARYSAALVHKDNAELLQALNKALSELENEGIIAKIGQKYFGVDILKQ